MSLENWFSKHNYLIFRRHPSTSVYPSVYTTVGHLIKIKYRMQRRHRRLSRSRPAGGFKRSIPLTTVYTIYVSRTVSKLVSSATVPGEFWLQNALSSLPLASIETRANGLRYGLVWLSCQTPFPWGHITLPIEEPTESTESACWNIQLSVSCVHVSCHRRRTVNSKINEDLWNFSANLVCSLSVYDIYYRSSVALDYRQGPEHGRVKICNLGN